MLAEVSMSTRLRVHEVRALLLDVSLATTFPYAASLLAESFLNAAVSTYNKHPTQHPRGLTSASINGHRSQRKYNANNVGVSKTENGSVHSLDTRTPRMEPLLVQWSA